MFQKRLVNVPTVIEFDGNYCFPECQGLKFQTIDLGSGWKQFEAYCKIWDKFISHQFNSASDYGFTRCEECRKAIQDEKSEQ